MLAPSPSRPLPCIRSFPHITSYPLFSLPNLLRANFSKISWDAVRRKLLTMSDPEKSVPPVIISQYRDSQSTSPQTPCEKGFQSPVEHSPASTTSRSESDNDERALTLTITQASRQSATRTATRITTRGTTFTSDPEYEVDFEPNDPGNPRNWSFWYKAFAIFAISFGTLGVVMYSTSYTSGMDAMQKELGVHDTTVATLGVTSYLFGLAAGSLLLAPIAETYGRRPVYTICMAIFTILVLPAGLAHNIQSIIVVRFFGALFGSAMIANAPGSIADLVSDEYRATAFSVWSIGPMNGPVLGPIIGGFVTQYLGWRWNSWIVMIWGGTAFAGLMLLEETYAPALLQRRAKKLRKDNDDERYWSRFDIRVGFVDLMKINLKRPFIMAVTEPICIFWNFYISLLYGEFSKAPDPMGPVSLTISLKASFTSASSPIRSSSPNSAVGPSASAASLSSGLVSEP